MSDSSTDRILSVIDAGLQTPVPDPTYGEVSPTQHDRCARCEHHVPVEGGDMCGGCRAFLLGDSETDPKGRQWVGDQAWDNCVTVQASGGGWRPVDLADGGAPDWRDLGLVDALEPVRIDTTSAESVERAINESVELRAGRQREAMCHNMGWFVLGSRVRTVECLVCGSPVARVDTADNTDDTRFLADRPWEALRVWLSPCGHTNAEPRSVELYRLTQHPIDRLGDVMWWASQWADYWGGDLRTPSPRTPRLAEVMAETDMVTLIDHHGQVVDRLRYRPAPGTVEVLCRPAPGALMSMETTNPEVTMLQVEEYRGERGGIYRRTR